MGTTTYAVLRQNLMKLLHVSRTGTCTTIGAAAGATLISTDLQKWDGGNNDHYNGQWIQILTSPGTTTNEGNERFVLDYATGTGTVTPVPAFTAQMSATGTFEIFPWEPASIKDAFQRAVDNAYPTSSRKGLFRTVYEEMVANSWIWNGHFEDWTLTTIPDHFVLSGTATVSEETTLERGPAGTSGVKMTGGGATDYIYQSQTENPSLLDLEGKTVTFYVHAYAAAATTAQLTIAYKIASDSALTTVSSGYHTGNSEHELLSKTVTLPEDITDLQIRLESTAGTVYFDNLYHDGGPYLYRYHMSKDFLHDPIAVEIQVSDGGSYGADQISGGAWQVLPRSAWHIEDDGSNRMLVLHRYSDNVFTPYAPYYRRKLRITGNETLTSPTAETTAVEVDDERMRALVALAAAELMLSLEGSATASDAAILDYKGRAAHWQEVAEGLLRRFGQPMPMSNMRLR